MISTNFIILAIEMAVNVRNIFHGENFLLGTLPVR